MEEGSGISSTNIFFCERLPQEEKFIIIPQLKRAAISVPSNIAEGFARNSNAETIRFLDIARSSLVEVDTQIEICIKLDYIQIEKTNEISELINHLFAMLTKLKNSIKTK